MTQEEKELLIKDLCGRVPYGVKFRYKYIAYFHEECGTSTLDSVIPPYHIMHSALGKEYLQLEKDEIKPYLFPLSSMTEKQLEEFYCEFVENEIDFNDFKKYYFETNSYNKLLTSVSDCPFVIDWLNKNHFDYRGLIERGLAIDATNLNIY